MKKTKPKAPSDLARRQDSDTRWSPEIFTATIMGNGSLNGVVTMAYLPKINGGTNVDALAEVGRDQAKAIASGDLTQLEHMLLTQSIAMQAMFVDLAVRARQATDLAWTHTHTTLALKCAAQSRQAITALAELRMPKAVMFAKQANVTTGPQQVNNGVNPSAASARAEKIVDRPNELLEAGHEPRLDTHAQGQGGRADPCTRALETVHRAAHGAGQGDGIAQRLQGQPVRPVAGAAQGDEPVAAGHARRAQDVVV